MTGLRSMRTAVTTPLASTPTAKAINSAATMMVRFITYRTALAGRTFRGPLEQKKLDVEIALPMNNRSDEETDDPLYADRRNFYKVEKWSRDGLRVELMLYAGNNLDKARRIFERATKHRRRIRMTIRQRMRVLDEWPRDETMLKGPPYRDWKAAGRYEATPRAPLKQCYDYVMRVTGVLMSWMRSYQSGR
jgi:hypothetical protein